MAIGSELGSEGYVDLVELLALYQREGRQAFAVACALTNDRASAEQVVIDAFATARGKPLGGNETIDHEMLLMRIVSDCTRRRAEAAPGHPPIADNGRATVSPTLAELVSRRIPGALPIRTVGR